MSIHTRSFELSSALNLASCSAIAAWRSAIVAEAFRGVVLVASAPHRTAARTTPTRSTITARGCQAGGRDSRAVLRFWGEGDGVHSKRCIIPEHAHHEGAAASSSIANTRRPRARHAADSPVNLHESQ